MLKFPKVNEILTLYCSECLPVYITIAFIELVDRQPSSLNLYSYKTEKFNSAVSLYKSIFNLPLGSSEVEKVLAFYLTASLDLIGSVSDTKTKLDSLKNFLKTIETKYAEQLIRDVLPNTV